MRYFDKVTKKPITAQDRSITTRNKHKQMNDCTLTKASLMMAIAMFSRMTAAYSSHMKKNTGPSTLLALTTEL